MVSISNLIGQKWEINQACLRCRTKPNSANSNQFCSEIDGDHDLAISGLNSISSENDYFWVFQCDYPFSISTDQIVSGPSRVFTG